MIRFYGITHILQYAHDKNTFSVKSLITALGNEDLERKSWLNVGSQLMPEETVLQLRKDIRSGKLASWDAVHLFYEEEGGRYEAKKNLHAIASLLEIEKIDLSTINLSLLQNWIAESKQTKTWIVDSIESSRKKDYTNPFRKMMHDTQEELEEVIGKFEDNEFINDQKAELIVFNKVMDDFAKQIV